VEKAVLGAGATHHAVALPFVARAGCDRRASRGAPLLCSMAHVEDPGVQVLREAGGLNTAGYEECPDNSGCGVIDGVGSAKMQHSVFVYTTADYLYRWPVPRQQCA